MTPLRFFKTSLCLLGILTSAIDGHSEMLPHIEWDTDSLRFVDRGNYGRLLDLGSGEWLMVYSRNGWIRILRSSDGGETWEGGQDVHKYEAGGSTNAEILKHSSGRILLAYNDRPEGDAGQPFRIGIMTSEDGGNTWSSSRVVFTGGTVWEAGCWEPALVELPDGRVQLLFADESAFPESKDQAITMLESQDLGETWSEPKHIVFAAGARDGMPVPRIRPGTPELWVSIESNGRTKRLTPEVIRRIPDSSGAYWGESFVTMEDPTRLSPGIFDEMEYAGAPYLAFLGDGKWVAISYQENKAPENPGESHIGSIAATSVGNAQSFVFGKPTYPFKDFGNPQALWNSLTPLGEREVILVASGRIQDKNGIYTIRGELQFPTPTQP